MMRRIATIILAIAAAAETSLAGGITGTLKPADRVSKVTAIDRAADRTYVAAYDPKTGGYRFTNLPRGTYDIILETTAGRIEGVNLRVEPSEVAAKPRTLAPSELDKGEILNVAAFLKKTLAERKDASPEASCVLLSVRRTKPAQCALAGPKREETELALHAVPLEKDELDALGQLVLGMVSLAKVRDELPRDFDLFLDIVDGEAGDIRLVPVAPELTDEDRKWIVDWIDRIRGFENKRRVLDLDGSGERAKALVEKLQDGKTTLSSKEPAAIWRVEILEFRKYHGGWNKETDTVVARENVPIRTFRTFRWMFEKRLGGIAVETEGTAEVPPYNVPEKLDPDRGRVPE